ANFVRGRPGDNEQGVPHCHSVCPVRRHRRHARVSPCHFIPPFALSNGPTGKQIAEAKALLLSQRSRNRKNYARYLGRKIQWGPHPTLFGVQRLLFLLRRCSPSRRARRRGGDRSVGDGKARRTDPAAAPTRREPRGRS